MYNFTFACLLVTLLSCCALARDEPEGLALWPSYSEDRNSLVTLVLETSTQPEYLNIVRENLKRWSGPAAVAVEAKGHIGYFEPQVHQLKQDIGSTRSNVAFIVYETDTFPGFSPINYMKNLGVSQAGSDFVLIVDRGFLISGTLFNFTSSLKKEELNDMASKKQVFMFPAFLWKSGNSLDYDAMAENKQFLLQHKTKVKPSTIIVPSSLKSVSNPYKKPPPLEEFANWWKATDRVPVKLTPQADHDSAILMHRSAPRFYEILLGEGCSKTSHFWELQFRNYTFQLIPSEFLLGFSGHQNAPTSMARALIRRNCKVLFKRLKHNLWMAKRRGLTTENK